MEAGTEAEIATLRAEVESLKTLVQQLVAGGGGDGFGPDFGLPITPFGGDGGGAFRLEGDKITHCNFYAAHQVWTLEDVEIEEGGADGTWYLNVDHNDLQAATVSTTAGANDDDHTAIPLFTVSGGAITKDYRGMPFVPIYA